MLEYESPFVALFSDPTYLTFLNICNAAAVCIWLLTLLTNNLNWMDRIWPIAPVCYAWGFLFTALNKLQPEWTFPSLITSIYVNDATSPLRLIVITIMVTIWGVRLFYTFWRRDFYKLSFEDKRWEVVRKWFNYPTNKLVYHLWLFFFYGILQNWLLLGLVEPMYFIQTHQTAPFNRMDVFLTLAWVFFYSIEATADEQQWEFQENKKKYNAFPTVYQKAHSLSKDEVEDLKRGFNIRGLFSYCRHPNYFGEVGMWWTIYKFSIAAQKDVHLDTPYQFFNYSMASATMLTCAFIITSKITEKLMAEKYVQYEDYRRVTSWLIPSLFPSSFVANSPSIAEAQKEE